ncbi:MAG: ribose 5-phosphate isomerase B [Oscillospiraceae bacterium]
MLSIGCDHGGYALKLEILKYLDEKGIEYNDMGCNGESCDYPDIAHEVCTLIQKGEAEKGILICGTGIGISISANKHKGIRAALCTDEYMAKYTRLHNDANVLCLGGRVIGGGVAVEIVDAFLSTEFEGGRHQRRIDKITELENN